MSLLFQHTIEGLYAVPEYGGNVGRTGWAEIQFPGDTQPRGYTSAEVTRSDSPDRWTREGIGDKVLALLEAVAPK